MSGNGNKNLKELTENLRALVKEYHAVGVSFDMFFEITRVMYRGLDVENMGPSPLVCNYGCQASCQGIMQAPKAFQCILEEEKKIYEDLHNQLNIKSKKRGKRGNSKGT